MKALFIYPMAIQGWEWIVLLALVLLLFGGRKIPELMKGLGKGVKSFKEGMSEVEKDVKEIKADLDKPAEPKKEEETPKAE